MKSRMRPLRILLADPPLGEEGYAYYYPTLGILYLLGSLRSAFGPADVEARYLQGFGSLKEHVRAVRQFKPDLYGLSFTTPLARLAYRTLSAVRAANPRLPMIAGGPHPTILPSEVLTQSPADGVLRGECEETIVKLVEAWSRGGPMFECLPGAAYKGDGELCSNPFSPYIKNIDDLPWPAWNVVDHRQFPGMPYGTAWPSLGIAISRGCPFGCTFCSEPVWRMNGKPSYRARSPQDVAGEVELLYQRGIREVRLFCAELNASEQWAHELLLQLARIAHADLRFTCDFRPDSCSPQLADAMAAARVHIVCMGIESASQATLTGLQKQCTLREVESTCELLRSRGIGTLGYFQLFSAWEGEGGLQWETFEDSLNTIAYAGQLHQRGLLQLANFWLATPRPGTPLYETARRHHLLRLPPEQPFHYLPAGMNLPGVTRSEVRRALLRAKIVQARMWLSGGHMNVRSLPNYTRSFLQRLTRV